MKFVVIGEPSGATMEQLMAGYPRHKAFVDQLVARGEVIGIGPFADRGNMAIFRSREAAEEFVREDPFAFGGAGEGVCHPRMEGLDADLRGRARNCCSLTGSCSGSAPTVGVVRLDG